MTITPARITFGWGVWMNCSKLTSVTFGGGRILYGDYRPLFNGDLLNKHEAGGDGTYTTANPGDNAVWTKQ
jgi:hypothetical protein